MVIQRWRPNSTTIIINNADPTNHGTSSDDSNNSSQLVATNISVCNRNVSIWITLELNPIIKTFL